MVPSGKAYPERHTYSVVQLSLTVLHISRTIVLLFPQGGSPQVTATAKTSGIILKSSVNESLFIYIDHDPLLHWFSFTSSLYKLSLHTKYRCVTVLGHSPLSCPVAWRWSSSPIGLGYRRYASTHPLNALQMAALRAAI